MQSPSTETLLISSLILFFSFWSWKSLYQLYRQLKKEHEAKKLFQQRHNTVLMYSGDKGLSGWVPDQRISLNIKSEQSLESIFEPVIYFIDSAEIHLDIAFMCISLERVYQALLRAKSRNVQVRVLIDFDGCKGSLHKIKCLMDQGIEIVPYISNSTESIMHCKFMVKDVTETTGYVFLGSLNLTDSAFLKNYEDAVITSNRDVAQAFQKNFQKCWDYVKSENSTLMNKAILVDNNLI